MQNLIQLPILKQITDFKTMQKTGELVALSLLLTLLYSCAEGPDAPSSSDIPQPAVVETPTPIQTPAVQPKQDENLSVSAQSLLSPVNQETANGKSCEDAHQAVADLVSKHNNTVDASTDPAIRAGMKSNKIAIQNTIQLYNGDCGTSRAK